MQPRGYGSLGIPRYGSLGTRDRYCARGYESSHVFVEYPPERFHLTANTARPKMTPVPWLLPAAQVWAVRARRRPVVRLPARLCAHGSIRGYSTDAEPPTTSFAREGNHLFRPVNKGAATAGKSQPECLVHTIGTVGLLHTIVKGKAGESSAHHHLGTNLSCRLTTHRRAVCSPQGLRAG